MPPLFHAGFFFASEFYKKSLLENKIVAEELGESHPCA
jgi:hypothetical protein